MALRDRTCVLLLALAPLALFLGVLCADKAWLPRHPSAQDLPWATIDAERFAGEPFNSTFSDPVNLLLPDLAFAGQEFAQGRMPLWNPWVLCGNAHAANPIAAVFYPPTLLAAVMPALTAMLAIAALHLFLAGAFFHAWMRLLGLRPICALFGGIAFQCSGWVAAHLHNFPIVGTLAWIILAFAAVDWRLRNANRRSLAVLACGLGMAWLAGFPQLAALGSVAVALYAALQIFIRSRHDSGRSLKLHSLPIVLALVLGVSLAAVQILPAAQMASQSARGLRNAADLAGECMRPAALLGWVLPTTLGDPMDSGDWREGLAARIVMAEGADMKPAGCMNWSERTLFPGWIVLALALLCVVIFRSPYLMALTVIGSLGLLLALVPPFAAAVAAIPGLNLGAPARSAVLFALLVPALAAGALDATLYRLELEGCDGFLRTRRVLWCIVALMAVGCALLWLQEDASWRGAAAALKQTGMEERFGVAPQSAEAWVEPLRPHLLRLRMDITRGVAALAAALLCFELLCRRRSHAAVLGLTALCTLELLWVGVPPNQPVSAEGLLEITPGLRFLQANSGDARDDRIIRVSKDRAEALQDAERLMVPNLPLLFGLRDVQGWREQIPQRSMDLWRGVVAGTTPAAISGIDAAAASSKVLDLAHVRWLVAARPVPTLSSTQVYPSGATTTSDLWVYENTDRCPRVWLVHSVEHSDDAAAIQRLHAAALDPMVTTLLPPDANAVTLAPPTADEHCRIVWQCSSAIDIAVDASTPALLRISESFDGDWEAHAVRNGSSEVLPVLRSDVAFMGVPVAAGHTLVTMRYRPRSIRIGMAVSGVAALIVIGLLVVRRSPAARSS
ncbi:MAG: hypothetical protein EXS14_00590 [Planctomycetes bacterium]|nr:hypothetical protein [Planctomycetota bacterium]